MLSSLIFSTVIQFQTRKSINCNMEKAGALESLCLLHGYESLLKYVFLSKVRRKKIDIERGKERRET